MSEFTLATALAVKNYRVRHAGLLHKLHSYGISGLFGLSLFKVFLDRKFLVLFFSYYELII